MTCRSGADDSNNVIGDVFGDERLHTRSGVDNGRIFVMAEECYGKKIRNPAELD